MPNTQLPRQQTKNFGALAAQDATTIVPLSQDFAISQTNLMKLLMGLSAGDTNPNPAGLVGLEVDAFGRHRLWLKPFNTISGLGGILRLGAFSSDGDLIDIPSEGIVVAGQNASGDPMAAGNWAIARIKPTRFGIENSSIGGQFYIWRVDGTQQVMRTDAGVVVFSVQRATGNTVIFGTCTVGGQLVVVDNDARLTNARTPTTHATTHNAGGTDSLSRTVNSYTNLTVPPVLLPANDVVLGSAGAPFAVTLPSAAASPGKQYTIKKIDASANIITVTPNGGDLIDGAASYPLGTQWQSVTIVSNGTGWYAI